MGKSLKDLKSFNEVLKVNPVGYLGKARAYPFLKWAGGKRTLIPDIVKILPERFNDYYEPFLGGGSVFFSLDSRIRKAHISDLNQELMLTYKILQLEPENLIKELKKHKSKHSKEYYNRIRGRHDIQDPVKLY